MLNHLRKNTRVIIWMIVGSFGIWGIGSVVFTGLSGSKNIAGKVYGKKISTTEFNRHFKIVQIFGGRDMEDQGASFVEAQAWQQIALAMKARQLGIRVSDWEVREEVIKRMAQPGAYTEEMYRRWVQNVFREGPRTFEEKIRDLVAIAKLLDQVVAEVTLTDEELKKKYLADHPDSKPEEFEKVKEGYRTAMIELAKLNKRNAFIEAVVKEADIRNYLEEERKAQEEKTIQTQIPGSPMPIRTPTSPPPHKEK